MIGAGFLIDSDGSQFPIPWDVIIFFIVLFVLLIAGIVVGGGKGPDSCDPSAF